MTRAISLSVDPDHRLLRFRLAGFLTVEDARNVSAQKLKAITDLGGDPTDHVSLVDVSQCTIQAQDVAALFTQIIANPQYRARRAAFLVHPTSLSKMQVRRMLQGSGGSARLFENEARPLCGCSKRKAEGRLAGSAARPGRSIAKLSFCGLADPTDVCANASQAAMARSLG